MTTGGDGDVDSAVCDCENEDKVFVPDECAWLKEQELVMGSEADFDAMRRPVTLSDPVATQHAFPGMTDPVDAFTQTATIGENAVTILTPASGENVAGAGALAAALSSLPDAQLGLLNTVEASPVANPDDAYWAEEFGMPDFTSAATAGGDTATFYPTADHADQGALDSLVHHEVGHIYSDSLWQDAAVRDAWQTAVDCDRLSPSHYAAASLGEDFSEFQVVYALSKDTPCEATARKLYPNRYAAMDRIAGEGDG